jgi:hypothetical protein
MTMAGAIIMMLIGIRKMEVTMTIIVTNVIVSVAENIIVIVGRTGKIIFR